MADDTSPKSAAAHTGACIRCRRTQGTVVTQQEPRLGIRKGLGEHVMFKLNTKDEALPVRVGHRYRVYK